MFSKDYEDEVNQNVIIDCDILEAAKENIQPLKGGRRVTALASALATPHGKVNPRIEATKLRLRERIREVQMVVDRLRGLNKEAEERGSGNDKDENEDGDKEDPDDGEELTLEEAEAHLLEEYVNFVKWTVEHYPRGQSAQSGILELIEEATRVLRHSEYAKTNKDYLDLWIRYASYVDHPELIYEFLLANEIGTTFGRLYESYAAALEKMNRRPKADEIYLLGIARKVDDLDRLKSRHREFQKRMMVVRPGPERGTSGAESTAGTATENVATRRQPLVDSTSTSTMTSIATPLTAASSTFDVFSVPSAASSIASLPSQSSRPRPNAKIPVFIDPTGEAAGSAPGNAWPELGTRAERIKENRRAPEKMQGAILEQRGAAKAATREAIARARATPRIVPYRDPEPAPAGPSALAPPATTAKKFEVFKDPEPPVAPTSFASEKKVVPFVDPEETGSALAAKPKFEVFRDPEPRNAVTSSNSGSKFVPFKDPEPPAPSSKSRKAPKAKSSTDVPLTPRRSARLNPKLSAKAEPESEAEAPEEAAKLMPAPPRFTPFKDEDASKSSVGTSASRETAMRPKVLGESSLAKATTEAEALRKDPFKNYK